MQQALDVAASSAFTLSAKRDSETVEHGAGAMALEFLADVEICGGCRVLVAKCTRAREVWYDRHQQGPDGFEPVETTLDEAVALGWVAVAEGAAAVWALTTGAHHSPAAPRPKGPRVATQPDMFGGLAVTVDLVNGEVGRRAKPAPAPQRDLFG